MVAASPSVYEMGIIIFEEKGKGFGKSELNVGCKIIMSLSGADTDPETHSDINIIITNSSLCYCPFPQAPVAWDPQLPVEALPDPQYLL